MPLKVSFNGLSLSAKAISKLLEQWQKFYRNWLQFQKPMLVLVYDNLKMNLRRQLVRICKFFDVSCGKELLECILDHKEGVEIRPRHNDSKIFNRRHRLKAKFYQSEVLQWMKKNTPKDDWASSDNFVL